MIVKSLGLESFANFLRVSVSENLVPEKNYRFQKIWSRKKIIGFRKFGLGKKSRFWFRKNLVSEKSLGFGNFGLEKKILVLVSGNLISEKKKAK